MKLMLIISMLVAMTIPNEKSIYQFKFKTIDGQDKTFAEFKGKKILIVNTASKCGFTRQYESLEALHDSLGDQLVIIGFPANNFGGQEPGTNDEIATFCKKNYGVSFLMAEKVSVSGKDIDPLFQWLTTVENDSFVGKINWNFEKFVINEEGQLIARYRSGVDPMDPEFIANFK
jgi:glutathione peroxidase